MRWLWASSLILISLTLPAAAMAAAAPKSWEFVEGRWQQVDAPATQATADPTLDRAESMIARGQTQSARKTLVGWFKTHKESPAMDRALFLMAQALFNYGDRIRAFYYLDQLMDEHPDSPLFYAALRKQYEIAIAYIEGYKRRLFYIPMLNAQDEGIEMLYRIQNRSPGSQLAEEALLRTADFYYADAQFDLAGDAYAAYARSYPRSPVISRVKLRQAFSSYAQFHGLRYDATPIIDAREQLLAIQEQYPDLAQEENVAQVLEQIDQTLAGKLLVTGDFYRRTHEPRAAAYTYQYLLDSYPNGNDAVEAQRRLERLPDWAVEEASVVRQIEPVGDDAAAPAQ